MKRKKDEKIILSLCLCIYASVNPANAQTGEGVDTIAIQVMNDFQNNAYERMFDAFYIPPYYTPEDIQIDKDRSLQVFKIFNQELGQLENYAEINASEMDNTCLGTICGIGQSGSYSGIFFVKPDSRLHLKTYKAHFSKAGELYVYIFIFNHRNRLVVTQFGVAFPQGSDESTIMQLFSQVKPDLCSASDRKMGFLALADGLGESHGVTYKLPTEGGEWLDLGIDYADYDPGLPNQNTAIIPPMNQTDFTGEHNFQILTLQGKKIGVKATYQNSKLVQLKLEPPKSDTGTKEMLTVETQGGFIINFSFTWNGEKLALMRVDPQTHPFTGLGYVECYGQGN